MRFRFFCLSCAAIIAGCNHDPVSNNNIHQKNEPPFAVRKHDFISREVVPSDDPRVSSQANSMNQFAIRMFSELDKKDENTFFSPYSITSALGMTDAGARGETEEQIRMALQSALEGDDFHTGINGLDQSLVAHSVATENVELSIVNSIWAQNGLMLQVNFLDLLSRHYDAGVNLLNFSEQPDSSRIIINEWVSEQTHQRINDLLPEGSITSSTALVLTNAIYFLADWLLKFDTTLTVERQFNRMDGSTVAVPMMKLKDKPVKVLYYHSGSCRILELPYKGNRLAMNLILPDSGTFKDFEQNLSIEVINNLIDGLDSTAVITVQIPRFQFTTPSVSLKEALQKMGMTAAFTMSADFSGISNERLVISDVLHKAFIKVDEEGTEAAAATGVILKWEYQPQDPTAEFVADRPFIFFIRDTQTGAILFMGRIMDPTVEQ